MCNMKGKNMEFTNNKNFFDPERALKAHQGTILAGPVLPAGLKAPFDHAWGYLDKPGEMESHRHNKEEIYFFFINNYVICINYSIYTFKS